MGEAQNCRRLSLIDPSWWERCWLERKLRTKTECRRRLYQQGSSVKRIECRGNPADTAVNRIRLIQSHCALAVKDIEPVTSQTNLFLLTDPDWVVHAQIKVHRRRRTL